MDNYRKTFLEMAQADADKKGWKIEKWNVIFGLAYNYHKPDMESLRLSIVYDYCRYTGISIEDFFRIADGFKPTGKKFAEPAHLAELHRFQELSANLGNSIHDNRAARLKREGGLPAVPSIVDLCRSCGIPVWKFFAGMQYEAV